MSEDSSATPGIGSLDWREYLNQDGEGNKDRRSSVEDRDETEMPHRVRFELDVPGWFEYKQDGLPCHTRTFSCKAHAVEEREKLEELDEVYGPRVERV